METEYIQSGMLFKKKLLGLTLASFAYNWPKRSEKTTKKELMLDLIESIGGNIWTVYLAKHPLEQAIFELEKYFKNYKEELASQINGTAHDANTKNTALRLLDMVCSNENSNHSNISIAR